MNPRRHDTTPPTPTSSAATNDDYTLTEIMFRGRVVRRVLPDKWTVGDHAHDSLEAMLRCIERADGVRP